MRRQKGLTLSGFMVVAIIVVIVLLLGFRLAPPYMEFHTVQKLLKQIAAEPHKGEPRNSVRRAFQLKSGIDNITAVNENDLQVTKDGDRVIITAEYTVRVPLIYNISACMDFRATSEQ
jgi:uncharacterized protein (DUF362 family)